MVRLIQQSDNEQVAHIIRTVMPAFGAGGKGFAIHDKEVDDMFSAYSKPRSAYFVFEAGGSVIGGGGIGPLQGGEDHVCELKKMYFLPEGRGKGFGAQVLVKCLDMARVFGFEFCYLETFNTMNKAMTLYEGAGFRKIDAAMGNTGHFACDVFYKIKL